MAFAKDNLEDTVFKLAEEKMQYDIRKYGRMVLDTVKEKMTGRDSMLLSRRNIALSTYMNASAVNLAGGNFFTGFLLLLQADDNFIGLVSMITLAGNLLQIFSPMLVERFPHRKRFLIFCRIAIYVFNIVLIGLIPYLGFTNKSKLAIVMVCMLFQSLTNAVAAPGLAIWHVKSIPEEVRAGFYSVISIVNTILVYAVIFFASAIADKYKAVGQDMAGLTLLRIGGVVFAILDIFFLLQVREYPNKQNSEAAKLSSILLSPFREKKYLLTVLIACLYTFTASIPGPYLNIYLLKDLKVSYSYLTLVNMINIPILVFITPWWAKRIRKTSWFRTLSLSMAFYSISYVGLSFVTNETMILYPVFMLAAFVFAPGINLTCMNIPYINMPETNQTVYFAFYSTMTFLSALVAVAFGRQFILLTNSFSFNILGTVMQNKQYILLITGFSMLMAAAAIAMSQKKTKGEVQ